MVPDYKCQPTIVHYEGAWVALNKHLTWSRRAAGEGSEQPWSLGHSESPGECTEHQREHQSILLNSGSDWTATRGWITFPGANSLNQGTDVCHILCPVASGFGFPRVPSYRRLVDPEKINQVFSGSICPSVKPSEYSTNSKTHLPCCLITSFVTATSAPKTVEKM